MIIIVGGSSGLGKKLTEKFSINGYNVLSISRSFINKREKNISYKNLDITNCNLEEVFGDLEEETVSAIFFTIGAVDAKDDIFLDNQSKKKLIDTNYLGITSLVKELIQKKKLKKNSLICFCTSVTIFLPRDTQVFYCSAKIALDSYFKSLSFYLSKSKINIRCCNLILGYLSSNMGLKDVKKTLPILTNDELSNYIFKKFKNLNGSKVLPKYWMFVKILIKLIPSFILKKLI